MAKKEYQHPLIEVFILHPTIVMAGSTGASGEDAPWKSKRLSNTDFYYDEDDEDEIDVY